MSVNYLVDYENVHEAGVYGMSSLAAEDCVYIFHTSATERIALSCFDDVQAWVKVILVPPGKQSLDMHLGSFLGYLIGKEEDPEAQYRIVSHDTDYQGITDFWNRACDRNDKVRCADRLITAFGTVIADAAPVRVDPEAERAAIHDFIVQAFCKHGVVGLNGQPCMLVSELCTRLNSLPEYRNARRRLDRKPMQYLEEECRDYLLVRRQWQQDWAYLVTEGFASVSGTAENMKEVSPEEPQDAASEMLPDEDLPEIMEMGDLSIDGELPDTDEPEEFPGAAEKESLAIGAQPLISSDPETERSACGDSEKDANARLDFAAIALECIREMNGGEKNDCGYARASSLRDRLLKLPGFRSVLKESGMKPIPFMQQQFAGMIRIWRDNGIYWAAPAEAPETSAEECRTDELAERRKSFFEKAFSNIQKQLTDAGLSKEAADEIADIFMRSNSAAEPRKVIHTLLCQRFGNKIGARYYRQAVKYVSM